MAEFQVTLRYPTNALVKVMEKGHGIHDVAITHKHDVGGIVTFLIDAIGGRLLNVKDANLEEGAALVTLSINDYGEGWHQKAEKEIRQLQEHIRSAQDD